MDRLVRLAFLCALVGCEPEPLLLPAPTPEVIDTGSGAPSSDAPGDTGPAEPVEPWFDCAEAGQPPFAVKKFPITTEEDFDFDGEGYLIHQTNGDLVGVDQSGDWKIVAPQVALGDPAGVSVLSTGEIVVATPGYGTIEKFAPGGGGSQVVASGLSRVNGLEVGAGDLVYFTETLQDGRASWLDPYSEARGTMMFDAPDPNGISLSPDEDTVYLSGVKDGAGYVVALDRDGDGWSPPRQVISSPGEQYWAMEVDVCGTIWLVDYGTGSVLRVPVATGKAEVVGDLDGFYFSNAHFGNGIGGWRRDTLYVTNRSQIHAISVGVPGRQHPTNPYDGPDP